MTLPNKPRLQKGQLLLSLLISMALFSILAHAVFTLVTSSYSLVGYIKAKRVSKNLAQEKIETIRNMPYEDIGTVGGIPSKLLPQSEEMVINGLKYVVKTSVVYIDDPFDQQAPDDLLAADYKRVRVDVSWQGVTPSRGNPVTLISDIAPQGIESTTGGGTLSVIVFDSDAQPISQADVHIVASTNPAINLSLKTSADGRLFLPGAPPCSNSCYQITVSKSGYSTDRTYSVSEVANPDKPNLNVSVGGLTEKGFAIDKVGSINVASVKDKQNNFESLPNITFQIRGDKIIGTDDDDKPVYKYIQTFSTGESGVVNLPELEWDDYTITVNPTIGFDISAANPFIPINLDPDQNIDFKFALSSHTPNSVLISFMDPLNEPITSTVSAELSYGETFKVSTESGSLADPDYSEVFFPDLEARIYNLIATASGYQSFSGTVDVIDYKTEKVIMSVQ